VSCPAHGADRGPPGRPDHPLSGVERLSS
jgi:hypothetical protein